MISDQDKEAIAKAYQNGMSCKKLGKLYNRNSGTIWYLLNQLGLIVRKRAEHYGDTDRYFPQIKELHAEGKSAYRISKIIGIASCLVLRLMKRHGLSTSHLSKQRPDKLRNHTKEIVDAYVSGQSTCQIAKQWKCGQPSVWNILQEEGITCRYRAKYTSNESYFDIIDTQEKAYILGWWYSDGNNMKGNSGIRIQISDKEIVEWIKEKLEYTGPLSATPRKNLKHKILHGLTINSKRLSLALNKLGCPPAKTFLLNFPTPDIVPPNLLKHFVRGYIDGDGSIGKYGRLQPRWNCQIVGRRNVLEGIVSASCVHGYFSRRKGYTKDNWTVHICGTQFRNFMAWVYDGATCWLNRKRDKYLQYLSEKAAQPPV
jgi:transposase